ncbi:hypothetical protein N7537_010131 [Penicillium hordei]|uniref:Uncharacterized protein n=1 Tax=Penicillium hordei TaxID=40994 RepID=A0AAD6DU90_9EURO|nr:uncharacterized protein N7537_010131 [Penicillium hordei]KAJ5593227.1 hypothetical protein N7537_010131 [Penicillium hordei]
MAEEANKDDTLDESTFKKSLGRIGIIRREDLSLLRLKYRSEEPAYRHIVDAVVALDAITYEALVESLRLGTLGSTIDPYPTPLVTKDTSVLDSSIAGLIPLRAVE